MGRHARSEDREAVRKPGGPESEKIGSRVLPPLASMPSVGTRRSTRAFVRKNVSKVDGDPAARVLRSGKRLTLTKPAVSKPGRDGDAAAYDWTGLFGSSGGTEGTDDHWKRRKEEPVLEKSGEEGQILKSACRATEEEPSKYALNEDSPTASSLHGKVCGVVYSRKRRRSRSDGSDSSYHLAGVKDSKGGSKSPSDWLCSFSSALGDGGVKGRRYGIAFVRKPRSKKPKLSSLERERPRSLEFYDKELGVEESRRYLADKVGISAKCLWSGSRGHVVLVALVHSTRNASPYPFSCFLFWILSGMMKRKVSLFECAAFVSSSSAAGSFFLQGIHFLPLRRWRSDFSVRISMSGAGFCIIFGAWLLFPLVSVNFSALPSLFKSWHVSISLCSLHLPSVLARYQRQWQKSAAEGGVAEGPLYDLCICAVTDTSKMEITSFATAAKEIDVVCGGEIFPAQETGVTGASEPAVGDTAATSGIKFRKRLRRKDSLRSSRASSRSLLKSCRNRVLGQQSGTLKVDTGVKVHPINEGCEFESGNDKKALSIPSPTPVNQRRRCSMKNPMQRIKKKSAAKQNIDVLTCTANILVIESGRCWREEGAKVLLESSSSNEWFLAAKLGNITRFLHKAEEMRASSSNRFTHAMMWTSENGWKLEFCDKNEWNIFKELYKECCERNMQEVPVRIIPVPGVQLVSGYEENFTSLFVRPDSYIHMVKDEVDRVLMNENACYDMDSGDEEWLERLNSGSSSADADSSTLISKDDFEKIISAFEKAAYSHPDDVSDQEKAASLCSHLGNREMVLAVFDYWTKKRKQKHSALIGVFKQGHPPRKRQVTQKPFLRRKRSIKRQKSQVGRGKPDIFFEAAAIEDARRNHQAAEAAASKAVDIAVRLRSRAQQLMTNADLVTYKSVMAVRLAEAIRESESPHLSSILG